MKTVITRFADVLNVEDERKRGSKDVMSSEKDKLSLTKIGNIAGRTGFGTVRIRS